MRIKIGVGQGESPLWRSSQGRVGEGRGSTAPVWTLRLTETGRVHCQFIAKYDN